MGHYSVPHHKEPEELIEGFVWIKAAKGYQGRRHIMAEVQLTKDVAYGLCGRYYRSTARRPFRVPVCRLCLRHYWYLAVGAVLKKLHMQDNRRGWRTRMRFDEKRV